MRVLVVSDIHANLEALKAVLGDCAGSWDQVWNLGDLVGYGPDPSACIEIMSSLPRLSVMGNHDFIAAAAGLSEIAAFNPHARRALLWTRHMLKPAETGFLARLPSLATHAAFTLVHGSPSSPLWQYVFDGEEAREALAAAKTPLCLAGHTYCRLTVRVDQLGQATLRAVSEDYELPLRGAAWFLNPGSVGFPRDLRLREAGASPLAPPPLATYALLDTDTLRWRFRRLRYDNGPTIGKMKKAGLLDERDDVACRGKREG
jgi:predicted phosphodiesterase